MENPDLVLQETGSRPTYSRLNYVPSGDTLRQDAISSFCVFNPRDCTHLTCVVPGRTHRSNQVSGPEYIFLISSLAGERRFASTVSKRLESLGALTHGDRRATDTRDLSQFNIDNKVRGLRLLSWFIKLSIRHIS